VVYYCIQLDAFALSFERALHSRNSVTGTCVGYEGFRQPPTSETKKRMAGLAAVLGFAVCLLCQAVAGEKSCKEGLRQGLLAVC
jgi:hypothetical protein